MKVSDEAREVVMARLTSAADAATWLNLSHDDKARLYLTWARDPTIGGVLQTFMSANEVHRYLKDTLVKTYAREKMADPDVPLTFLGIPTDAPVKRTFIKPHGVLLEDHRVVAWSSAEQWKSTIMAVFERSRDARDLLAFGAVLFNAEGKFADEKLRATADDAGKRLGVRHIIWN
jgi:hypothetical protein